jgi:hypothetical protein
MSYSPGVSPKIAERQAFNAVNEHERQAVERSGLMSCRMRLRLLIIRQRLKQLPLSFLFQTGTSLDILSAGSVPRQSAADGLCQWTKSKPGGYGLIIFDGENSVAFFGEP